MQFSTYMNLEDIFFFGKINYFLNFSLVEPKRFLTQYILVMVENHYSLLVFVDEGLSGSFISLTVIKVFQSKPCAGLQLVPKS